MTLKVLIAFFTVCICWLNINLSWEMVNLNRMGKIATSSNLKKKCNVRSLFANEKTRWNVQQSHITKLVNLEVKKVIFLVRVDFKQSVLRKKELLVSLDSIPFEKWHEISDPC